MRAYLASRFGRWPEMQRYEAELVSRGHTVTSSWHSRDHLDAHAEHDTTPTPQQRHQWANRDIIDIYACSMLISFTEEPRGPARRLPGDGDIEVWVDLLGYRLPYKISSFGRVRNGEDELIDGTFVRGYKYIKPDGKHGRRIPVHQLVAHLFIGPCPVGNEVDHLDGYKANNWVGNLEYVTHIENVQRARYIMSDGRRSGVHNSNAKLTDTDVAEIRYQVSLGRTKVSVARDYDITDVHVGNIVRGKMWPSETLQMRGGRNVEYGAALALAKTLVVVGPVEHIFHELADVHFESWEEYLTWLDALA